jgi:hypothetical protein
MVSLLATLISTISHGKEIRRGGNSQSKHWSISPVGSDCWDNQLWPYQWTPLRVAIHSTESTRGSTEWIHDPFHEVGRLVDYIIHPFHSKRSWSGWSGFEAQAHKRSRIALATDQSMHILETHASLSAAGSSLYLSFFLAFSLGFRILAVVAQQCWQ